MSLGINPGGTPRVGRYLVAARTALHVVDVGGFDFGVVQHLFEQFDLLLVGRLYRAFQPETFGVGGRVHRGRVHALRVFGALHVHDDHSVAARGAQA